MKEWSACGAVLRVDKPEGPTSHDIVAAARKALGERRIGHTGTLDPFASGLLLLCIGPATRLSEYLTGLSKQYQASMRLGVATDTDDLTGKVVAESAGWHELAKADVEGALAAQRGTIQQLPPLFSAKKVNGERMYAAARRGETPERSSVEVTIHRLELLCYRPPDVEFEVECSSGTYVRAIARDLGDALEVGGHLRSLRRTLIGEHGVVGAISPAEFSDADAVGRALLSPVDALAHLPAVAIDGAAAGRIANGGAIPFPEPLSGNQPLVIHSTEGDLLAIGEWAGGHLRPRKVFH